MVSLLAILGSVPDPLTGNAQRHGLLDMLVIALAASVCGAESCVDFAEFGEDRQELLREFLSLENGLPSHDTFSRLFRLLDPAAFGRALAAFLDDLGADGPGVMAIDGKTLRRSFDRAAGRSPLHVVTAFGPEARLVIGQSAVVPGGNEITAARALLETLCLDGVLVTADALHTQTETAALVRARGGDYARRIVGWRVSTTPHAGYVLEALEPVVHERRPVKAMGLVHHSNRGSQYLAIKYTERLAEAGIEPSVGSVGDSYDTALAETINGLFKAEVIHRRGPWRNFERAMPDFG